MKFLFIRHFDYSAQQLCLNYLRAMAIQSSRKAEALVVNRTRSNAVRRSRFSSLSFTAGVLVEDVTGNGGHFCRRDVLEVPVTAPPLDDRWSPGQVKGPHGVVSHIVADLLEQPLLRAVRGGLVQSVADGLRDAVAAARAYVESVHPIRDDRTFTW